MGKKDSVYARYRGRSGVESPLPDGPIALDPQNGYLPDLDGLDPDDTSQPEYRPTMEVGGHVTGFQPGTVLEGKFEVQHLLGKGAMGEVYLARDVNLQRSVAVKVLGGKYWSPDVTAQFREEAQSMAQVEHPNVVGIYSFGEQMGTPYFVMELLDGESLADFIDRRELEQDFVHLDEAIGVVSQVCKGLSAIHAGRIVHRDVKPANVMITSGFRVAVTDFGLVGKIKDTGDQSNEIHGTPIYIAPERIGGKQIPASLAHSCDLYSLGVVLYELLTFEAPFDGDSVVEILDQHLNSEPPRATAVRPDLPPTIDDVIGRAMSKRPEDRFESAEEMRKAILEVREAGLGIAQDAGDLIALVIDPDPATTLKIIRLIHTAFPGATVLTAVDGKTGLEFVRELRPNILIVDAQAHQLNALELCTILNEEHLVEGSKILVMSQRVSPVERGYLKELGVTEVLSKPVVPAQLLTAIRSR